MNLLILSKRGITSLEIVMAASIISLISLVIISMFLVTQAAWGISTINMKLQTQLKQPLNSMIKEIKEAGASSPIGVTVSPDQKTITFAIPKTVSSNMVTSWQQVSYSFNAVTGQITRTDAATSVIGNGINSVSFSKLGNVITIALSATGTASDGRALSASLSSQVSMRN